MKLIALLSFIFSLSITVAQAQDFETQIVQTDAQLNDLIKKNEATKAEPFYAEDFVLTTSAGKLKTKIDMLNEIGFPDLKLEVNETENVKVRVLNSTAVLTGKLHQKGNYKGQRFDHFLLVTDTWVKTDTGWKLLSGHATLLSKP
jgi:ketosteroid isomerase-like protein